MVIHYRNEPTTVVLLGSVQSNLVAFNLATSYVDIIEVILLQDITSIILNHDSVHRNRNITQLVTNQIILEADTIDKVLIHEAHRLNVLKPVLLHILSLSVGKTHYSQVGGDIILISLVLILPYEGLGALGYEEGILVNIVSNDLYFSCTGLNSVYYAIYEYEEVTRSIVIAKSLYVAS